jgi:hypothetical protein
MDVISVTKLIQDKIKLLVSMRKEIRDRSVKKADAIAEHDKALAITLIRLKNGETMGVDGHKINRPGLTVMGKIAKGIVWQERHRMEEADALYKSLISNIDSVQSELNGLQSINRWLEKA